jgi:hypothetical protein
MASARKDAYRPGTVRRETEVYIAPMLHVISDGQGLTSMGLMLLQDRVPDSHGQH